MCVEMFVQCMHGRCLRNGFRCVCNTYIFFFCGMGLDVCAMHTKYLQNTFRCVCNTYVFFCGLGLDVCLDVCAMHAWKMFVEWV